MWYLSALFVHATGWGWWDSDARVFLCELLVVSRWLWVVEKHKPVSRRIRGTQYPVVIVLFRFVGVQEGVSRHLILFAVRGPAGTQLFFSCHNRDPNLLTKGGCGDLIATKCATEIVYYLFHILTGNWLFYYFYFILRVEWE